MPLVRPPFPLQSTPTWVDSDRHRQAHWRVAPRYCMSPGVCTIRTSGAACTTGTATVKAALARGSRRLLNCVGVCSTPRRWLWSRGCPEQAQVGHRWERPTLRSPVLLVTRGGKQLIPYLCHRCVHQISFRGTAYSSCDRVVGCAACTCLSGGMCRKRGM